MGGPFVFALATGEKSAGGYLFSAAITLFAGFSLYIASAERRLTTDLRSALLFVLLWWSVTPLFAALPFALAGQPFFDGYFEAVSALTTTGGWLSHEAMFESEAGILWRAELEWIGGLASLAIAAAIFVRPAFIGVDTLLPPFSRGDRESYLRPVRDAVGAFAGVYVLITFFCFGALSFVGVDAFDAVILALSVVASGGMTGHPGGVSAYPPLVPAALFPFVLLSGANFVLIARLMKGGLARARDVETGGYVMITVGVGALFWLSAGAHHAGLVADQLFNAASFLSTNGFVLGEAPPLTVLMITAIIGGAAVSTAGGFKILRWLVIMRRAHEEIRRLIEPSGVFGSRRVANELGVWMHFLVFTMTLAALMMVVASGGHSFEIAAATATAILSNTGPLLALAEGGENGYGIFGAPIRFILIVGMILGRLEAVAALALFNRAFWRS
ncbi:MAG: potassium transporter TrkG [Amphiplicatus sp.]